MGISEKPLFTEKADLSVAGAAKVATYANGNGTVDKKDM